MSLTGNAKAKETLRGKINGLKTIHGYSAYEVAVVKGFEGTEEEWLHSLKGEQGEQGKRGERGIQVEYDPETQTLHITGGEEDSGGGDGIGIVSIEQTSTSTVSGGVNVITATKADGSKSVFYIRNGGKGDKGDKGNKGDIGVGIASAVYENGKIKFTLTDGNALYVTMPEIVTPDNCYTKSEIDTLFGNYIEDVSELLGGGQG